MAKGKKFEPRVFIPVVSASPTKIACFSRPIDGFHPSSGHARNWLHLENNDHNGKVSEKARKKIELAVTWLLFKAKPKRITDAETGKSFTFLINFITLTLPSKQVHTDQEIKDRCLNNFLQVCRKNGIVNYLWRAEAQPNTGNIHFHITTDKYIHYEKLRQWWNQSVGLLGYLDAFQLSHGHRNPNSTDIHSVKHIKRITSYLSKYLGKNRKFPCIGELRIMDGELKEILYKSDIYRSEGRGEKKGKLVGHMLGAEVRNIEGRLWGCSASLSKCKSVVVDGTEHEFSTLQEFINQSDFKRFDGEHTTLYFGKVASEAKQWFPWLYEKFLQVSR
jgi:hypothetical protein